MTLKGNRISSIVLLLTLMFSIGLNTLLVSPNPLFASASPTSRQTLVGSEKINGLFAPRIDGFIDDNAPTGYLGEWDDAVKSRLAFTSEQDSTLNIDVDTKHVSGNLYISFTGPETTSMVALELDRDNNQQTSGGDAKIILENGIFSLQIYVNNEWHQTYIAPEDHPLVGAIAGIDGYYLGTIPDNSEVEIGFSEPNLDTLLALVGGSRYRTEVLRDTGTGYDFTSYRLILRAGRELYVTEYAVYERDLRAFLELDVGIDHIELTQAIQNETNGMPLVRNKPTLARVFVTNPHLLSVNCEVKITAFVIAFIFPIPVGSVSTVFAAPATETVIDRNNIDHSANLEIPALWLDNTYLILKVEVSPVGWTDPDSTDNTEVVGLTLTETRDLNVFYIRVNEQGVGQVTEAFAENHLGNMTLAYPMANPTYTELDWDMLGSTPWVGTDDDLIADTHEVAAMLMLAALLLDAFGLPVNYPDQVHSFCLTPGGGLSDPSWSGGASYAGWTQATDFLVAAHEINHNLGPGIQPGAEEWGRHVYVPGYATGSYAPGEDDVWKTFFTDDNIHEPGWFPGATALIPSTKPDFMTYSRRGAWPTCWISDYRWLRLFDRLANYVPGNPVPPVIPSAMMTSAITIYSTRLIQGFLYKNGTGTLLPSFAQPSPVAIGTWPTPEAPSPTHYLNVYYLNGSSQQIPLQGDFTQSCSGGDENTSVFSLLLRDDGQITVLNLTDSYGSSQAFFGDTGFTATGTLNSPTGISRGKSTTIDWTISLTNSTNIWAQLQYSHDNIGWLPISHPTLGSEADVTFNKLPGSPEAGLRLLLSDGVLTRVIYGDNFSLSNLPPTVKFTNPNPVIRIPAGSVLSVSAKGWDPETGAIPNASYSWVIKDSSSSVVATGSGDPTFQVVLDTPGTYEVKVTVTDSVQQEGTATLEVQVISPAYLAESDWNEYLRLLNTDPFLNTLILIGLGVTVLVVIVLVVYFIRRRRLKP